MAQVPPHPKEEPRGEPVPDFHQALSNLSNNPELPSALDLALPELEKRLFRYAKVGPNSLRWPTRCWCWRPGPRRGWGDRSQRPSIPRDTCRWLGWASGVPPARVQRGTPSRTSLVLRMARSSDPNSDAGHETALFTNVVEKKKNSPNFALSISLVWPRS
jgi:hypothetical protein